VRQSAFALLGDLSKACIGHIRPHINHFIPIAAANLGVQHISVCNNASWAIGEIALKIGRDIEPFIPMLLQNLIPRITGTDQVLGENPAITLGRLCLVCPDSTASSLEQFGGPWCDNLANICDPIEKDRAFQGLCSVILKNPRAMLPHFPAMCTAFVWDCTQEMHHRFYNILHSFKQQLGADWNAYFGQCSPQTQAYLSKTYSL
jgi:transportin-1